MNLNIHFLFYCNTKCIYSINLRFTRSQSNLSYHIERTKGISEVGFNFTSGDSRQNSHSSSSANFTQIPEYLKDIAIPSKGCLA